MSVSCRIAKPLRVWRSLNGTARSTQLREFVIGRHSLLVPTADSILLCRCISSRGHVGGDGTHRDHRSEIPRSPTTADFSDEDATSSPSSISANTKKRSKALAYADLAKARLTTLVVATTAAGFVAAGPLPLATDPAVLASVVTGTALCSASAAAWNQIWEIPRDAQMKRTVHRPLVTGLLSVKQATTAATLWGVAGTTLLWMGTDPVTTILGVGNIVLYAGIYTALKPVSTLNTWVGAVVGAVPPVMGYSAATAITAAANAPAVSSSFLLLSMDPIALTLGATLYLWQLPHFMALSYMYRTDYSRGGFAMIPCHTITGAPSADVAAEHTANVIVRYAWYLAAVPLVATVSGVTSPMYALEGLALNAYAIALAHRFQRDRTNQRARHIFLTSLWYLPCTLMLFLLHSKTWDDEETETVGNNDTYNKNALSQFVAEQIRAARAKGRELCLHEAVSAGNSQACPSVVGKELAREAVDQAATEMASASERLVAADTARSKNENKQ